MFNNKKLNVILDVLVTHFQSIINNDTIIVERLGGIPFVNYLVVPKKPHNNVGKMIVAGE